MAASRPSRDVDAPAPTTADDLTKSLTDLFDQAKKAVEGALTKENVDKIVGQGKEAFDKATSTLQEFSKKLTEEKPAQ